MSFKIVQELQTRGYTLVIIPEAFEENNVFWYPPSNFSSRRRNAIVKNAFAQPEKNAWIPRPCAVKRKRIRSYEDAEKQEEELLAKTVTTSSENEHDASDSDELPNQRNKNPYITRSPQPNFDQIAAECLEVEGPMNYPTLIRVEESELINNNNLLDLSQNAIGVNNDTYVLRNPDGFNSTNLTVWDKLIANQVHISKNQQTIMDELKEIKIQINNGFAKIFTQIEHLTKSGWTEQAKVLENTQPAYSLSNFSKIASLNDAKMLEHSLNVEEHITSMVSQMAYIVEKGGDRSGDGWTCCYELIDAFFKRSFLADCSWTGASTSKDDGKIPFLSFKNILLCYSKIIINADPTFSLSATQNFFKSLLRNSTRFVSQEATQLRKSSKRSRNKSSNVITEKKLHLQVPDLSTETSQREEIGESQSAAKVLDQGDDIPIEKDIVEV